MKGERVIAAMMVGHLFNFGVELGGSTVHFVLQKQIVIQLIRLSYLNAASYN